VGAQDITFRDAGLHSTPLRAINRVGSLLKSTGINLPALTPASLTEAAIRKAGCEDFGDFGDFNLPNRPHDSEALTLLCQSMNDEARLTTFGRIAMKGLVSGTLENRLRLVDWAKKHPEVHKEKIEAPWVILGLPRTGTTLLSILLGLDPTVRPLQSWEASKPIPPPDLATAAEDPRIIESAKMFQQLHELCPAIAAMHPIGATMATECVTLLIFALRALTFETQFLAPSYGDWLEKCDMRGAYAMHRLALQALQSRIPTSTWSLKTPQHLWSLEALTETYPDARLIWTHRDPVKVVPSVASLVTSMHSIYSDHSDPKVVAAAWQDKFDYALRAGASFDDQQQGRSWCSHVSYERFVADPIATVTEIYASHDLEVLPLHRRRMETWLQERGQDAFGRHRYDLADFGLEEQGIRERFRSYTERYDV
jgi:hypothetical protein